MQRVGCGRSGGTPEHWGKALPNIEREEAHKNKGLLFPESEPKKMRCAAIIFGLWWLRDAL